MLDEPLEGLAPEIVEQLCEAIGRMVKEEGQALMLVEQRAEQALRLTHCCIVMERGRVVHGADSHSQRQDMATLGKWVGVRLM